MKNLSVAQSLWCLQFFAIATFVAWAALDALFLPMVDAARGWFVSTDFDFRHSIRPLGIVRPIALAAILIVALVSMLCILGGMLLQSTKASALRSINAWLALTTAFALWCGLIVNVEAIAWHGKRLRIASQIDSLERVASQLRDAFPTEDGELPHLGPFMAYPFGRPSTLILLKSPTVNHQSQLDQSLCISAVQRSASGAILLQLSGTDGGYWAEWHPPHSRPQSFVGGLGDSHTFAASYSIGRGWHLVRYKNT